jgi:DNA helicase-2/ATP-dependent DNA helicase PcrA
LTLAADPSANDALVGLLMGPPWRIGVRDMALLARRAVDLNAAGPLQSGPGAPAADLLASLASEPLDGVCLIDALLDPGQPERYGYSDDARRRFGAAAAMIRRWQRGAGGEVADLVRSIAVDCGLAVELALGPLGSAPGGPPDDAGLVALVDLARRFDDAENGRTLHDFLRWLAVAETLPDGPEAPKPPDGDAVTVMTVHASKGLEFPVVVLPGMVEGAFPSDRGRGTWPTSPTAIPAALLADPAAQQLAQFPADPCMPRASEHQAFTAACRAADRLEETRLAYVAATRARQLLIMSGHRWGRTQTRPRLPSPYLLAATTAAESDSGVVLDVWALPPDDDAQNPALAAATAEQAEAADAAQVDWQAIAAAVRAAQGPIPGLRADAPVGPVVAGWDRDLAAARTELAARRGPLEVAVPVDLSVSAWLAMRADPDGFARQLARPVPQPAGGAAAAGEAFHAWVAAREAQLPLWEVEDLIDVADASDGVEQTALQQSFAASPFGPLVPIAVEHPFALRLAGRLVRGRIDAVYVIDGRHWIVDWKTGSPSSAQPLQLALYRAAWAAERGLAPAEVVGCFVFLSRRRYDVYENLPEVEQLLAGTGDGNVAHVPQPAPTSRHRWAG